jgi:hypothetical protein
MPQSGGNMTSFSGVNQSVPAQQPFLPQEQLQPQQNRINWLEICMDPLVDYVITEPCSTLTTADGFTLTPEGQRVLSCLAVGALVGILDPALLIQIRELGPAVGCAG